MDIVGGKTLEIMSAAPWYNDWLVKNMRKYLGGEILEVGAGIGTMSRRFSEYGKITAIDFNRGYVSKLKKLKFRAGFGDIEKGKYFFSASGAKGVKKFDTIVSTNVLEHIKDDKQALKNMSKLLKKDGKLVLLVPAHSWAYGTLDKELGHYRRYTINSLSALFEEVGLEVLSARYIGLLSLIGWFLNGRILRRKLIPVDQLKIFNIISRPFLSLERFFRFPFGQSVLIAGSKK